MTIPRCNRFIVFGFAVFFLSLIRFSYFGFTYIPYLDDHIQYFYYPSFQNPWTEILSGGAGTIFTRPLAGILDVYFWSLFKNHLFLAVLLISLLHGLTALLFLYSFQKININLGKVFLVIFIFMPVNTEATYWLSASTRIVVSEFFVSLALLSLTSGHPFLFALFEFLSMWFYEQTAVISLFLGILFCLALNKKHWALAPVFCFLCLGLFYMTVGELGNNAYRLSGISFENIFSSSITTLKESFRLLTSFSFKLIKNSFRRGIMFLMKNPNFLWLFSVLGLSLVFSLFSFPGREQKFGKKLLLGIALTIIPLTPFFILKDNFIHLRNIAPCLIGVAIVLDALFDKVPKKLNSAISTVLLIVFMICTVSEIYDYQNIAKFDYALAEKISEKVTPETKEITVSLTKPNHFPQNALHGDHVISATESYWGISGIVRTITGNKDVVVKVQLSDFENEK